MTLSPTVPEPAIGRIASIGGPVDRFPGGFGYDLWVTYLVWGAVVASMYPLCRWYSGVKSR